MSRLSFLKHKIVKICILALSLTILCMSLPSCTKSSFVKLSKSEYTAVQNENRQNKANTLAINNDTMQSQDNILAMKKDELDVNDTIVVKDSAVEIVEEKLAKPFKTINIAIIAPVSGKYAGVGNAIVESAMLYSSKAKYQNTININIYDIGKLSGKNWKENSEVKRLINDGNDIVIGSVFATTTEKLLSVLPSEVLFITFLGGIPGIYIPGHFSRNFSLKV